MFVNAHNDFHFCDNILWLSLLHECMLHMQRTLYFGIFPLINKDYLAYKLILLFDLQDDTASH